MTLSTGTLRVGILAILAGLVGAYVIQSVLTSKPVAVEAPPANIVVPLAATELPEGRIVELGDVALVEMSPKEFRDRGLPAGMVMTNPEQIIGRRLRDGMTTNQSFTTNLFYLENTGPDITAKLKPGFRAYSMQIPDVRGGSINPGTTVDVLFRTAAREAEDGLLAIPEMTVTLLQSIDVVNVDRPRANANANAAPPGYLDLRRGMNRAVTADRDVGGHFRTSEDPANGDGAWRDQPLPLVAEGYRRAADLGQEGDDAGRHFGNRASPPPPPVIPPFITETWRRGQPDIRGYDRRGIYVWQGPAVVKPGNLPAPNALPGPMDVKPMPMPMVPPANDPLEPEKVELPKP